MKSVISAFIIFIIIITTVISSCVYTENVVNGMLQSVYENENFVAKNNWQKALDETEILNSEWENNRRIMEVLFNHSVIERIDSSIKKLNNAVKMLKKEDFIFESKNLQLLLKSLTEQQKISVGNIL
ncbi:MAG: DUF4363 family protein [Clostridia bacterium]|nr:DUF4363 family protein [Clostridia bacterium]